MGHLWRISDPRQAQARVRHGGRAAFAPLRAFALLALLALWLATALPALAALAAPSAPHVPAHASAAPAGHVTIIVLDMSGSMAQNDPNGLRCSAANAYIDLSRPGDFVGVVGLDAGSSAANDSAGFPATVDWGLAPRELSTVAARAALRSAIAQKSNNCAPDGNTPTYDALAKAQAMLTQATQSGASGSVILLTDGIPAPNPDGQVSAIQKTLLPQFKAHNWPVDTVALGSDQSFRGFLSDLSSATSGSFYDDGHGVVPGVSPLNITPFFIQIFRVRNGRSPGPDIPPTALEAGGVTARNFSVGAYVSHLDIVVVKDNPVTAVSVVAPNGQRFPPAAAGTFVSTDPHYAIFAVDAPQPGAWEVDLSRGGGQFLMDSLKVSTLALNLVSPADGSVLALGEPFTLSATLSNQGTPISGGRFSLSGHVQFSGGAGTSVQDVQLSDPNGTGVYSAAVTVPAAAPPGSYAITVTAHSASEDVIAAQRVLRFELFPTPVIYTPGTSTPATGTVTASAVAWDPLLSLLYRLPVASALGGWALDGHTAQPSVVLHGQVRLKAQPYGDATVSGTVAAPQSSSSAHAGSQSQSAPVIAVAKGDNGTFQLVFPASSSGSYALNLATAGAFAQTHGDLTHVTRTARVTVAPATLAQEVRAWLITLFYLAVLALLFLLVRFGFAQKPFGELAGGDGGQEFVRAQRAPWSALLHPGRVTSRQMGLDSGLVFLFRRGGRILVRGVAGSRHFQLAGRPVPAHPVPAAEAELRYDDGDETLTYVIRSQVTGDALDDEDEAGARPRGVIGRLRGPRPDEGDDLYGDDGGARRRRGLAAGLLGVRRRSRQDDDDDEWDAPRTRRARGRASRDDDDEVYSPRRGRGGNGRSAARRIADDGEDDRTISRSRGRAVSHSRYDEDGGEPITARRGTSASPSPRRREGWGVRSDDDEDYSSSRRAVRRRRAYDDDDW
ncbi:MAG TPA: vWA domain-containing protein [Ktedonobacterales bacterium]